MYYWSLLICIIIPISRKESKSDSFFIESDEGCWKKEAYIEQAVKKVDAILILTEWEIYKNLNWDKISKSMRKPSWVFDARSIVDRNKVESTGLNLWMIGDGIID